MNWQSEYDVVVVGSGAGGLVSAITAAHQGLSVLLIEKGSVWGGSSALSGGGLWIPNNHVSLKAGLKDSEEEAMTYMENVIEDRGPSSTYERKLAYVKNGHVMVQFLEDLGMKWVAGDKYPDYYPEAPGGKIGRSIEGEIFDANELGEWAQTLRTGELEAPMPLYSGKVASIPKAFTNVKDLSVVAGMMLNGFKYRLKGAKAISIGAGLVSRLMRLTLNQHVPVWLSTPLIDLILEDNHIVGVEVEKDGVPYLIKANAVILAGGGFEHNDALRKKYHNVGSEWSSASVDNTGDMLLIAQKHNLDTALLDDAWWGPATLDAKGARKFLVYERSMPHCLIVDQSGERYMNESESYVDAGHAILERQDSHGNAIPSWLILESRNRNRYLFSDMMPRRTPKEAIDSGFFIKADSVEELAQKTGVDLEGLNATFKRFNSFVDKGVDEDFGRGNSAYDNYYGDLSYKNPNLGHMEKPPFYACKIFPGDLGTKGGIVANEYGQALKGGEPVIGLYATGNCSASVMGRVYPGPGSTLGPTTVFGYISANHIAKVLTKLQPVAMTE